MRDQEQSKRIPLGVIAGVSAAVVAAGGGAAWWSWNYTTPTQQPAPQQVVPNTTQTAPQTTAQQPGAETTANIYLLKDTGKSLELVPQPVKITGKEPQAQLESVFQSLLTQTPSGAAASTIPSGTKLNSIKIAQDGIHVDLSAEFISGGGSASMTGRLGQVIYTATTLDPSSKVWLKVDGKPLETLGGEGVEIEQPMTRKKFKDEFPL